jgi:hypothetical protein
MKTRTDFVANLLSLLLITGLLVTGFSCRKGAVLRNEQFAISLHKDLVRIEDKRSGKTFEYKAEFTVLHTDDDPSMAHRPAGISEVPYNVVTWHAAGGTDSDRLDATVRDEAQQGDGFDDRILEARVTDRTANLFKAGQAVRMVPERSETADTALVFHYEPQGAFALRAWMVLSEAGYPKMKFECTAQAEGYYSVGYTGAPSFDTSEVAEIWQPMIWQEKRFPAQSYMTLAYRCPLPSALATAGGQTFGVVADPSEFPFDPLPLADNSRFGVAIRNDEGRAQPLMFAPVLGGTGSSMQPGDSFNFTMQIFLEPADMLTAYKTLAREVYGFHDYRSNGPHQLNRTLNNMVEYGMSSWSHFVDSLKGCAYSTDVPGAVKNVSALNPLEMALILDSREIYDQRAYPIIEYLLSREKFLFSLDREQKIQNPSRKMDGPAAPVSELAALYDITHGQSPAFLRLAQREFEGSRTRNLDKLERGDTWQNALAMYRASGKAEYLEKALAGAEEYIENRVLRKATDFEDTLAQAFFWTGFVPDYIGLFQLYESSDDRKFLDAAHHAALQYTQFVWFSPEIPDKEIVVNKGGEAPLYWYLKAKGHDRMPAAEETVPAWRLSAIGLTPESSGTCQGHRAIFMAHHAPWMYRIGYAAGDQFLVDVARSAIVGRYSNFPGYHINTARTTIYEKPEYPLRPFKELSVNSFHFNHIWPLASVLVDYLVTDAYVRSDAAIDFPSEFIEGYAYLQSKFYGHEAGTFYGEKAWLWMPGNVLDVSSNEINFLTARGEHALFVAFCNQSDQALDFSFELNQGLTGFGRVHVVSIRKDNGEMTRGELREGSMQLNISPKGITTIAVGDMEIKPAFQQRVVQPGDDGDGGMQLLQIENPQAKAMILDLGRGLRTAYIYLEADDAVFRAAEIVYSTGGTAGRRAVDTAYPYEFTVELEDDATFEFSLAGIGPDGSRQQSDRLTLGP